MFAIQPGVAEGAQFLGGPPPGVCPSELQPDSNSNFMTSAKDTNENWHGMPGQVEPVVMRSSSELPSDNQDFQAPGLPEGEIRSPPEGAEIPGAGPEKTGGASTVCSPLEDNGYASSSLSVDSPSRSPESAWDPSWPSRPPSALGGPGRAAAAGSGALQRAGEGEAPRAPGDVPSPGPAPVDPGPAAPAG